MSDYTDKIDDLIQKMELAKKLIIRDLCVVFVAGLVLGSIATWFMVS